MRLRSLLLAALLPVLGVAQAPNAFDFQGVARDAGGYVLAAQGIGLRIGIRSGTATGPVEYQETHTATTNAFGLFSIAVGNGTATQGDFASVAWGAAPHFLQVEMDADGGSDYVDMGTTQLLSVPYALHAGSVACPTVSLLGDTLRQGNGCFVIVPGISAANGGCLDIDGDGFYHIAGCGPLDCDDTDAQVHPGGTEICGNGLDDDCDGGTDDLSDPQFFLDWHPDSDGDGFGDPAITVNACAQPAGHTLDGTDCDDTDAGVFPGQGCSLLCTIADIAWVDQNQALYIEQANAAFVSCFGAPDQAACISGLLSANPDIPLSPNCHECFAQRIDCILQNCLTQCISPGPACDACIAAAGCDALFITCMGLTDTDGDGWADGSDCAPNDPAVHPGAAETCGDGIDSDCDGDLSEGEFMVWPDNDNDGFGDDSSPGMMSCFEPSGFVAINGDCDDNDPSRFPGAALQINGVDDDCDGQLDDFSEMDMDGDGYIGGIPSDPWLGDPILGGNDCDDQDPDVFPGAQELCDGIDNNCDGQVDEGDPGGGVPCSTGLPGQCGTGTRVCQSGTLICVPNNAPGTEVCDGIDNDCDGQVDEGNPGGGVPCSTGLPGQCGTGTRVCQSGTLICVQNPPGTEVCDGIDNDCDGQVDEGGVCD